MKGRKRVCPVDTIRNGRTGGGVDAVLECSDYRADQVHFGTQVANFVSRNRVDADLGQPKRVLGRRQAVKYDVRPSKVDLQPRAPIGVLRRQLGRKPDQHAHL